MRKTKPSTECPNCASGKDVREKVRLVDKLNEEHLKHHPNERSSCACEGGRSVDGLRPELAAAAKAYTEAGMAEETTALERMLAQYVQTPLDYDRIEAEYESLDNPYKDDWERIPYLVRHLCENAERHFYVEA